MILQRSSVLQEILRGIISCLTKQHQESLKTMTGFQVVVKTASKKILTENAHNDQIASQVKISQYVETKSWRRASSVTVEIKLHVRRSRTVVFLLEKPINAHFQYNISVAQAKVCISHSVYSRAQFRPICSFL